MIGLRWVVATVGFSNSFEMIFTDGTGSVRLRVVASVKLVSASESRSDSSEPGEWDVRPLAVGSGGTSKYAEVSRTNWYCSSLDDL